MFGDELSEAVVTELVDHSYAVSEEDEEPAKSATTLKVDIITRWNSLYTMFDSFSKNYKAIQDFLFEIDQSQLCFKREEKATISELMKLLKPFKVFTEFLSQTKQPTQAECLIKILQLKKTLDDLSDGLISPSARHLLVKILTNFDNRIKITEKMIVAALLEPNLKSLNVVQNELRKIRKTDQQLLNEYIIKHGLESGIQERSEITGVSPSKRWLGEALEQFEEAPNHVLVSDQLTGYLNQRFTNIVSAREHWLATDGCLKKLTQIIHAIPISSCASERTFSAAGRMLTPERSLLDCANLRFMMFVKQNYNLCKSTCNTIKFNFNEENEN